VIVLETSALIAVYKREADADRYLRAMAEAGVLVLPATCFVESVMALSHFASAPRDIEQLVDRHGIIISTLDEPIAKEAANAFLRYGKGRGHPAQLNFGDCFSYAVAKHLDVPLLYKGGDFVHTDIKSALPT